MQCTTESVWTIARPVTVPRCRKLPYSARSSMFSNPWLDGPASTSASMDVSGRLFTFCLWIRMPDHHCIIMSRSSMERSGEKIIISRRCYNDFLLFLENNSGHSTGLQGFRWESMTTLPWAIVLIHSLINLSLNEMWLWLTIGNNRSQRQQCFRFWIC